MASSRQKNPVFGLPARIGKADKRAANSLERHKVRFILFANPEVEVLPIRKEPSDPWDMAKEGKVC